MDDKHVALDTLHPLLIQFRQAFIFYMDSLSTVGYDLADVPRRNYVDAKRAWFEAGCPMLREEG